MQCNLHYQMSNYQELMTQMQHDLESGLESMADALANTGGDTAGSMSTKSCVRKYDLVYI